MGLLKAFVSHGFMLANFLNRTIISVWGWEGVPISWLTHTHTHAHTQTHTHITRDGVSLPLSFQTSSTQRAGTVQCNFSTFSSPMPSNTSQMYWSIYKEPKCVQLLCHPPGEGCGGVSGGVRCGVEVMLAFRTWWGGTQ